MAGLENAPWRISHEWGPNAKAELKKHCEEIVPEYGQYFNILLTGQIKSGKSSFYNSVCSVFKGRISHMAQAGEAHRSLTKKYVQLKIKAKPDSRPLSLRICDTMGLDPGHDDRDVINITKVIDGHVPNGHEFSDAEFNIRSPGFIRDPKKEDEVHCVVIVIDAQTAMEMDQTIKRKIKRLNNALVDRDVPILVLLTKVDMICMHVHGDVSKVYHSNAVHEVVSYISKTLVLVPENQVLPVVNYVKDIKLTDKMDVLLLTAISEMVHAAQGYLEKYPSEEQS